MSLHGAFSAADSPSDNDKGLFPECNLTSFKDHPFVLTHKNSTIRELVDHIFIHAGFKPDVLFETSNNHAIVSAVHSGICCGIISMYYVRPQDPHIRYFALPEHPEWNICAAHRKDHYLIMTTRPTGGLL